MSEKRTQKAQDKEMERGKEILEEGGKGKRLRQARGSEDSEIC